MTGPGSGCDGCLGDRNCWVCLGQGAHDAAGAPAGVRCARCAGSGRCPLCHNVVVLPDVRPQRANAGFPGLLSRLTAR